MSANNGKPLPLSERHLEDLRSSGLTDATIRAAGIYSEKDEDRLAKLLNWSGGAGTLHDALVFVYRDVDGEPVGYAGLKPDSPRFDRDGKAIRYEAPKDRSPRAFFPPTVGRLLRDKVRPVIVTEGEKKSLAGSQAGFACIGLAGVWSWQKKRDRDENGRGQGPRELIPDLAGIDWRGRTCYVVFDIDPTPTTASNVSHAARELVRVLEDRGASAYVVNLPASNGAKVGLDDFLLTHSADDLRVLLDAATPKPEPPPAYEPFPIEAMPEPLSSLTREAAAALQCDEAMIGLPALIVAAGVIGDTREIMLRRDWCEPSVLWGAVVCDSGTKKTPASKILLEPLYRLQDAQIAAYTAARTTWEPLKAAHAAAVKSYLKGSGPDPGPPPPEPTCTRYAAGDCTVERLAELLDENPRGLLMHRDELSAWVGSFARYRANGSDLPIWLSINNAGRICVDRKGDNRRTTNVPRALASVFGTIQPGTLARVLAVPEFVEAGLLARFLVARPPHEDAPWTEAVIGSGVYTAYAKLLYDLVALKPLDTDGRKVPHTLTFNPEAKRAWVKLHDEQVRDRRDTSGPLLTALRKLTAFTARLILLHHAVSCVGRGINDTTPIGVVSVDAGAVLARWFAHEARRMYAALDETPAERKMHDLAEYVTRKGGSITARDLMNNCRRRYPTTQAAEVALDQLVREGVGSWVNRPPTSRGGHPTRIFQITPTAEPQYGETPDAQPDPTRGVAQGARTTPAAPAEPPQKHGDIEVVRCCGTAAPGTGENNEGGLNPAGDGPEGARTTDRTTPAAPAEPPAQADVDTELLPSGEGEGWLE
jgi:hypothetical protein